MQLDVLLFAAAAQAADSDRVTVEVPDGATAGEVFDALSKQFPPLSRLIPSCRLAVDCTYVESEDTVAPEAEVALIPPVSGG